MAFIEAFKIGVSIALSSNVASILGVLGNKMLGLGKEAEAVKSKILAARVAAVGLLSAGAGMALGKGIWDAAKASEKLRDEQIKLGLQLGYNEQEVKSLSDTAWKMTRLVKGTTWTENLVTERELGAVLQHPEVVQSVAPLVAAAVRVLGLETGRSRGEGVMEMTRFLEMRGAIKMDEKTGKMNETQLDSVNKEITGLFKAVQASGGMLKLSSFLATIQQGGPAISVMHPDELYGQWAAAMMAMGPYRAGTALMSFFQQQMGGPIQARALEAEKRLGLLDMTKVKNVGKGRTASYVMEPGALKGFNPAKPIDYILNVLRPILMDPKRQQQDKDALVRAVFQISSRSTTARLINDIVMNPQMFKNEMERYRKGKDPIAGLNLFNDKSLTANISNLGAAWENFMTVLGDSGAMDLVIWALKAVTNGIDRLSTLVKDNPEIAKTVFTVAAGISALAVGIGVFALGGVIMTALATLGGPVGIIALVGVAAAGTALALSHFHDAIANLLPDWLTKYFKPAQTPLTPVTPQQLDQMRYPGHGRTFKEGVGFMWDKLFGGPATAPPIIPPTGPLFGPQIMPPPSQAPGKQSLLQNNIYLDGRKIAEVVSDYLGRSRPASMPTGGDPRRGALIPGSAFG